jgi:hypothetical protein
LFVNLTPAINVDSRGMSWQASEVTDPNGVFQTALRAVPYSVSPYSTQYPALPAILTNMPGVPLNNVITRNITINGTQLNADSGAMQYLQVSNSFGSQDTVFATVMSDSARSKYSDFALSPSSPAIAQGFQASQFSR